MHRLPIAASVAWLALFSLAPAAARDCRPPPPGVRAPLPAGCVQGSRNAVKAPEPSALETGREPGAIRFENGSELRIRGRLRVDAIGGR